MRNLTILQPFTLTFVVFVAARIARGDESSARRLSDIYCGVTLEWLADTCPYIGLYTAETVKPDFSGHVWIGASLTETLRGKPPERSSFDYPPFYELGSKTTYMADKNHRFLVFFRDVKRDGKNEIDEEHIISLRQPNTKSWNRAAISPDFSVITDGKRVEKVVRDRISKVAVTPFPLFERLTDRRRVEVPRDTPAFKALWDGENRVFLIVPDDLLPLTKKQEVRTAAVVGLTEAEAICNINIISALSANMAMISRDRLERLEGIAKASPKILAAPAAAQKAREIAGSTGHWPVVENRGKWFILENDGHPASDGFFRASVIDISTSRLIGRITDGGGNAPLETPSASAGEIAGADGGSRHKAANRLAEAGPPAVAGLAPRKPLPDRISYSRWSGTSPGAAFTATSVQAFEFDLAGHRIRRLSQAAEHPQPMLPHAEGEIGKLLGGQPWQPLDEATYAKMKAAVQAWLGADPPEVYKRPLALGTEDGYAESIVLFFGDRKRTTRLDGSMASVPPNDPSAARRI